MCFGVRRSRADPAGGHCPREAWEHSSVLAVVLVDGLGDSR
jgi:hypothetical protein